MGKIKDESGILIPHHDNNILDIYEGKILLLSSTNNKNLYSF